MPHPDMHANGEHPDEGLLHEWLDDQLSPADAAEIQLHIASCATCGARIAEARGLIAASRRILLALDEVPAGVIPSSFSAADPTRLTDAHAISVGVVPIDSARKTARTTAPKRAFSWQRAASIAAVLLVAVTVTQLGTSNLEKSRLATTMVSEARTEASNAKPSDAQARAADATPSDVRAPLAAASVAETASVQRATPATAKPEQVARAKSSARNIAPESSKKLSEPVVADASGIAAASPAAANSATSASAVASLPLPILAARVDATARGAAAGGRGGGRVMAGPPTTVASAASSGMVGNTPPLGAAMASPPPVSAPLATLRAPAQDTTARRAELEQAQRAQGQVQRVIDRTDSTSARSTLQLRGFGDARVAGARIAPASAMAAAPAFDSVTLERTECSPACESTSLHITALGVVRYVVGVGNTQHVVMSQLSVPERAQLQALVSQSFSSSVLQRGRIICSSPPATSERKNIRDTAPAVQLLVDMPGSSTLQPEQRCAKSATELREIGARVDAIAGTDAVKRRVPPGP
ncbi:MAG: zf-HC2 domain-containing protein [Gemmatimonadaceae bacterium]